MMNTTKIFGMLAISTLILSACGTESAGLESTITNNGLMIGQGDACVEDGDCLSGLECELEHGEGSCEPHGGNGNDVIPADADACETDADCFDGMECELDNGGGFCKEHGGNSGPN